MLNDRWHREHLTMSSETLEDVEELLDDRVSILSLLRLLASLLVEIGLEAPACACS